jgi:hypothetical protein
MLAQRPNPPELGQPPAGWSPLARSWRVGIQFAGPDW